jgi:hypothetical protein
MCLEKGPFLKQLYDTSTFYPAEINFPPAAFTTCFSGLFDIQREVLRARQKSADFAVEILPVERRLFSVESQFSRRRIFAADRVLNPPFAIETRQVKKFIVVWQTLKRSPEFYY